MQKLKPCPFCGGKAKFFIKTQTARGQFRGWRFGIHCTKCSITTANTDYSAEVNLEDNGDIAFSEDERFDAVEAWNRRVNDG